MKWLLGTYTVRFNRRHKEFGHLFSGRYKSLIVHGSGNGYLKTVCDYVHLNPVRANLLRPRQSLESYPWSSYGQYLKAPGKRVSWLRTDRLLGEWGIPKDSPAGRQRFAQCMEHRRKQENPRTDWRAVERGWFLGDKEFKQELLAQMHQARRDHYGPELREADLVHAQRVLQEELARRGWTEAELERRRKGDPDKVEIASQLRARTTMTLKWIAQRLRMGAWTHVSNCLVQKRKNEQKVSIVMTDPFYGLASIRGGASESIGVCETRGRIIYSASKPTGPTTRLHLTAARALRSLCFADLIVSFAPHIRRRRRQVSRNVGGFVALRSR